MTLGEKIRHYREREGMKQDELASLLGITKQTVHKYEVGIITNIPLDKIETMAKRFRLNPCTLTGWIDEDSCTIEAALPPPIAFPVIFDDETLEHAEVFQALDPRDRGELKGFANGLLTAGQRDGRYGRLKSQSSALISGGG